MNIINKINLLIKWYNFFNDNKNIIFEKLVRILFDFKEKDFDLEFCYFYKNKKLERKFKFEIISENLKLIDSINNILPIKWKEIISNTPLRWFQFVFIDSNLETFTNHYILWLENNIIDFSIKYTEENNIFKPIFRNYVNKNFKQYKNWITIWKIINFFEFTSILYVDKIFFWEKKYTYYFLINSKKYSFKDIEKKFNISIPKILTNDYSIFGICISKDDYKNKIFDNFSIYFSNYWIC